MSLGILCALLAVGFHLFYPVPRSLPCETLADVRGDEILRVEGCALSAEDVSLVRGVRQPLARVLLRTLPRRAPGETRSVELSTADVPFLVDYASDFPAPYRERTAQRYSRPFWARAVVVRPELIRLVPASRPPRHGRRLAAIFAMMGVVFFLVAGNAARLRRKLAPRSF